MKYRIKKRTKSVVARTFIFWRTELIRFDEYLLQYKKHWWSLWKTIGKYGSEQEADFELIKMKPYAKEQRLPARLASRNTGQ